MIKGKGNTNDMKRLMHSDTQAFHGDLIRLFTAIGQRRISIDEANRIFEDGWIACWR